jgi:hypothetical protein
MYSNISNYKNVTVLSDIDSEIMTDGLIIRSYLGL